MPPDHEHFSGRLIPVGLRRMPGREMGAQADWIICQPRKFPQLLWLVPMRPQPWSLAGLTAGPGRELAFALAPYHPAEHARGIR
ncbi:MAG: hypothetical protein ACRDPF_15315 [Streptosporangiaceae bacterium]